MCAINPPEGSVYSGDFACFQDALDLYKTIHMLGVPLFVGIDPYEHVLRELSGKETIKDRDIEAAFQKLRREINGTQDDPY